MIDLQEIHKRLKPQSDFHRFVVEQIRDRRDYSEESMSRRYDRWRVADESFVSYISEKDDDRIRKGLRESGQPQYTTLHIPFDYATLMSAHTYLTSVFLGRTPVYQFEGRSGEPEQAKLAVETLVAYQTIVGKHLPPLYVWLMDVAKYGLGILGTYWCEENRIVTREVEVPDMFLGVEVGTTHTELQRFPVRAYQGTKFYNISPYDFYSDPTVTPGNFQDGEFAGRRCHLGWNEIQRKAGYGQYFNLDAVKERRGSMGTAYMYGSQQARGVDYPYDRGNRIGQHQDLAGWEGLEFCVELIPSDWKLGDSDYPEKWVFTLLDDELLIGARPLGTSDDQYPYDVLEYEVDGYAMFKKGVMDLAKPMTDVIDWLVNTHFYNTRKSLNDMWVIDPMKVVYKDVADPEPGKIIRLKEEAYGQDVRSAIWQFPTSNVTQNHMADTQVMSSLIQRVTGVNDQIMGMIATGGRKTATEVRTGSSFGVNRLKTTCEWFSATGFATNSQRILQYTQELYDGSQKYRIAGNMWQTPGAEKYLQVSSADIQGMFDFVPVDGTLPVDRYAQVNMWSTMLGQIAQVPQVFMQYDLASIFGYIAQLGGLKNIDMFKIKIGSTADLINQQQQGNVVPMGGQGGRKPSGQSRGPGNPSSKGGSRVSRQVVGMGPSG